MLKKDLLKLLENVDDNSEIFVVSSEYLIDDDSTWSPDFQTEITKVEIDENKEAYLFLEVSEFM